MSISFLHNSTRLTPTPSASFNCASTHAPYRHGLACLVLCALCLLASLFCFSASANAAETQPGDTCSTAGLFRESSGADATAGMYFLYCDGSTWDNVLSYSSAGNLGMRLITGANPPVTTSLNLDALSDVSLSSPANGEVLTFDGTNWVNQAGGGGGSSLWTAGSGDDIYYNSGTPHVGIGLTNPLNALDIGAGGKINLWSPDGTSNNLTIQVSNTDATIDQNGGPLKIHDLGISWTNSIGGDTTVQLYNAANTRSLELRTLNGKNIYITPDADAVFSNQTSGVELMRLTAAGNLGIGTTSPTVALDVVGDIQYTGGISDVSDRRLKENIVPITHSLDKIAALKPVSFTMKADKKHRTELGLIAQDVEPVYPMLVNTTPDGTKTMNYVGLIGPMVEAIKELKAENARLKARLDRLEHQHSAPPPARRYND